MQDCNFYYKSFWFLPPPNLTHTNSYPALKTGWYVHTTRICCEAVPELYSRLSKIYRICENCWFRFTSEISNGTPLVPMYLQRKKIPAFSVLELCFRYFILKYSLVMDTTDWQAQRIMSKPRVPDEYRPLPTDATEVYICPLQQMDVLRLKQ